MKRVIKYEIGCCGECPYYSLNKHKCLKGAKDEGKPTDSFYADCPIDYEEIQENTMYQSLAYHQHETVREILCDKYGIEGDDVDEMIDEIICGLNNLKIF